MGTFDKEAIPATVRRLKSSQSIGNERERHFVVERMLVVLFKLGETGRTGHPGHFQQPR